MGYWEYHQIYWEYHGEFHSHGDIQQWLVYFREHAIKMNDLEVSLFQETLRRVYVQVPIASPYIILVSLLLFFSFLYYCYCDDYIIIIINHYGYHIIKICST